MVIKCFKGKDGKLKFKPGELERYNALLERVKDGENIESCLVCFISYPITSFFNHQMNIKIKCLLRQSCLIRQVDFFTKHI